MEPSEYLREDFNYTKLKKQELVKIINRHTVDEIVDMSSTKDQLVEKFRVVIVARRETLVRQVEAQPSETNIETAQTVKTVTPASRGRATKPAAAPKPLDISLSPAGPRTRSRSRSRSPERSPFKPKRAPRKPVEVIPEAVEEQDSVQRAIKDAVRNSPRKRKVKSEEPKAEPKEELREELKEESHDEAESSFSSENPFQSSLAKRKRTSEEGDRPARRANRKDVAPHKHKHAAPAQTLPENAREVFELAPDLQAPANLSHEPFDVSYGEQPQEDFLDQVMNLPDSNDFGEQMAEQLAASSTPAKSVGSFLPSFSDIQSKITRGVHAADEFAGQMNELATPEVNDSELEREADEYKAELKQEIERAKEVLADAKEDVEGYLSKARAATQARISTTVNTIRSFDYARAFKTALDFNLLVLKAAGLTAGTILTAIVLITSVYTLLWVRQEKLHQGYCVGEAVPIRYPQFLERDYHPALAPLQARAYNVLEELAPACTPCPDNAHCTLYNVECTGTMVKRWPLQSYLKFPSAPECVADPKKVHALAELKRRVAIILNNQRAAFECGGSSTAEVKESDLKAELYTKRAYGVGDAEFGEYFERARTEFASGDPQFPEISVRQVKTIYEEELTQSSENDAEEQDFYDEYEEIVFVSSSLASVSMTCRVRLWCRDWLRQHRHQLVKLFSALAGILIAATVVYRYIARQRRLRATYDEFIDIVKQVYEEAENDTTGKLRGYVVTHTLEGQISDLAERTKISAWVEQNPNVRVRELEQNCEIVKVWEWVPS